MDYENIFYCYHQKKNHDIYKKNSKIPIVLNPIESGGITTFIHYRKVTLLKCKLTRFSRELL